MDRSSVPAFSRSAASLARRENSSSSEGLIVPRRFSSVLVLFVSVFLAEAYTNGNDTSSLAILPEACTGLYNPDTNANGSPEQCWKRNNRGYLSRGMRCHADVVCNRCWRLLAIFVNMPLGYSKFFGCEGLVDLFDVVQPCVSAFGVEKLRV